MKSPSFRDLEQLSAYLDGQIPQSERTRLESTIKSEPGLGVGSGRTPPDAGAAPPYPPASRSAQFYIDTSDGGYPAPGSAPRSGALVGLGGSHAFVHLYAGGRLGRAAFPGRRFECTYDGGCFRCTWRKPET